MEQEQGLGEAAVAPYRGPSVQRAYMWLPGLRLPPLEEL